MSQRPIVIFAPEPTDLSRPRLVAQFAAGFVCGIVATLLLLPVLGNHQPQPGKAVSDLLILVEQP